jgi:hypothetical protein
MRIMIKIVNHHKMTFVIFVMKICMIDMSQIANHNKFDFDFVFFLKNSECSLHMKWSQSS